jgi:tetratricopeptide (TPR) repeat protein
MKSNQFRVFVILTVVVALFAMSHAALAQGGLTLPRGSQYASVTQRIGLTDISITYHRPGVKEREIWGGLVPYEQVWRAGANENTTISFTHDVMVEGKKLSAGTYGLHMVPTGGDWTIVFSKNYTSWGSFSYTESEDAARVTVTPRSGEHWEWLEYGFEDVTKNSAEAQLRWEKLVVPFKVEVDADAVVLQNIRNELRNLQGFFWQGWNQAANYCMQNNMNHDEAIQWADRSIGFNKNVANMSTKSRLLLQKENTAEAEKMMQETVDFAKQTGQENDINMAGYLYLQTDHVKEAIDVFKYNVEKYPESWNVYDSLGEGYAANNQNDLAIENYRMAHSKAPENQKGRIEGILKQLENK